MRRVNEQVGAFTAFVLMAVRKGVEVFPNKETLRNYLKTEMSRFHNLYNLMNNGRFIVGHNEEVIRSVSEQMFAK
jgi:hypothetical protein